MADLYIFKDEFDPIMLPNERVRLITANDDFIATCVAVGALPEYQKDFGELTAGTWLRDQQDTNLEMQENELSHLRMRIIDDVRLEFSNLSPTKQWRTSGTNFYLTKFPEEADDFLSKYMFKASEFFIWKDDTPRFDLYSEVGSPMSRILFSGWRYRCRKVGQVSGGNVPSKTIYVSGWPSGS